MLVNILSSSFCHTHKIIIYIFIDLVIILTVKTMSMSMRVHLLKRRTFDVQTVHSVQCSVPFDISLWIDFVISG